jgi:hypothetical protein
MRRVEYPWRSITKVWRDGSTGARIAQANQLAAATIAIRMSQKIFRMLGTV